MHEEKRELSRKERDEISKYLKEGVRNLDIFMYSLAAKTRPPERVTEVALSFAAVNGATQQEITDWEQKILKLPINPTGIEKVS